MQINGQARIDPINAMEPDLTSPDVVFGLLEIPGKYADRFPASSPHDSTRIEAAFQKTQCSTDAHQVTAEHFDY
jgi:hypothetical protein